MTEFDLPTMLDFTFVLNKVYFLLILETDVCIYIYIIYTPYSDITNVNESIEI